jgi:hypothetical protein
MIESEKFKQTHRTQANYFSRERILSFQVTLLLILRKSAKSLQLWLNELRQNWELPTVTASAFSQARQHLSHTAFIALQQDGLLKPFYEDGEYQRWCGWRVLAIDGSEIRVPDKPKLIKHFGSVERARFGSYTAARASVMYDVFNHLAVASELERHDISEVTLAERHLPQVEVGRDVLLFDRGYGHYHWLAQLNQKGIHFVVRCKRSSTLAAMFAEQGAESQFITFKPGHHKLVKMTSLALPETLTLRVVRVILSTGEVELLATNLKDEILYPSAEFAALYHARWQIETFYGRCKTRLDLENFSGYSVEAVKQDFFAIIFLTSLEAILTDTAQSQLAEKSTDLQHTYQVNHGVAFHAIKSTALDLLFSDLPLEPLLAQLTTLFLTNPTVLRPERLVPRTPTSAYRSLKFFRFRRKICF